MGVFLELVVVEGQPKVPAAAAGAPEEDHAVWGVGAEGAVVADPAARPISLALQPSPSPLRHTISADENSPKCHARS